MYALNAAPAARTPPIPFPQDPAPGPSLESVFRGQLLETFAPGQAVFWQGDPAKDVFEIRKGIIRLYRILPGGKRAIVGFIFPGDVLGVAYRDQYLFTAEAVTDITLRRLSRKRFNVLVSDSPELRPTLLTKLCDEMCAAQDQMLLLLHRGAEARVASFLLTVARKMTGNAMKGTEIQLSMSRTDIGDYLGLTIETICRCVSKLKSEGLITLEGPHRIILNKPRALKEIAGDDDDNMTEVSRTAPAVWPN